MAGGPPGGGWEAFLANCQSSPGGHWGEPLFPILWQDFPECSGVFNGFPLQRLTMRLKSAPISRERQPRHRGGLDEADSSFPGRMAEGYVEQKASGSQLTGVPGRLPGCSPACTGTQPLCLSHTQAEHSRCLPQGIYTTFTSTVSEGLGPCSRTIDPADTLDYGWR